MRGDISALNFSRKDMRVEDRDESVRTWLSKSVMAFLFEIAWAYDDISSLLIWLDTTSCGGSFEKLSAEKKFDLKL